MFHHLQMNVEELEKLDNQELAIRLRNSMPEVSTQNYQKYLADLELSMAKSDVHTLNVYDPAKGCLVTNLSHMPVGKLNFGNGNPLVHIPLTIAKNAAAVMADKDHFYLRLVY
jgi:hypothetical protein